jgi:hypothetical protein
VNSTHKPTWASSFTKHAIVIGTTAIKSAKVYIGVGLKSDVVSFFSVIDAIEVLRIRYFKPSVFAMASDSCHSSFMGHSLFADGCFTAKDRNSAKFRSSTVTVVALTSLYHSFSSTKVSCLEQTNESSSFTC